MSSSLELKLIDLVKPLADSVGLDLVELVFIARKKSILQIFVDKQGGVDLDDLSKLNELVGDMLDAEDPISGAYALEVSSPGLDRPLKTQRDFWRKVNELVRIDYRSSSAEGEKNDFIEGEISEVTDEEVVLTLEDGSKKEIAISTIIKGSLIY